MRAPLAPTVVLLVLLAGCSSGGEPSSPKGSSDPSATSSETPTPSVDPGYGAGVEVVEGSEGGYACSPPGSEVKADPNRTYEGGAHQHDEWGGQDEKIIFDATVAAGYVDVKDAVVITGTGRIDFKASWSDTTTPTTRTLTWTMPGDGKVYKEYTHTFQKTGQNHSVPINLSNNDPPHYKRTTWSFELTGGSTQFVITIFRGYDCLPIDPPHYDHWAGATEKLLSVTVRKVTEEYVAVCAAPANHCSGLRQPPVSLTMMGKNTSVPPGTQRLVVEISWKNDHPYPLKLGLEYQTATTDGGTTAHSNRWRRTTTEISSGPDTRTLLITPQPEDWDSPYDTESLWRFRWFFDSTGTHAALGNSGVFKGEATFKFTAHKT